MRIEELATLILICLPSIYTISRLFLAFEELNPFMVLGFIAMFLLPITLFSYEIVILMLYVPAITSIILAFLGHVSALLGLASGYLLSLSLIILLSIRGEERLHISSLIYFMAMILNLMNLMISQNPLTPRLFLVRFFGGWRIFPSYAGKIFDPIFLGLMAPSTIGFLSSIPRDKRYILSLISSHGALASLLITALLLLIASILPSGAAWIACLVLAASSSLLLILYLRVVK